MKNNFLKKALKITAVFLVSAILAGTASSCNFFEIIEMPSSSYTSATGAPDNGTNAVPVKGGVLTMASTKYDTLDPLKTSNYYVDEALDLIYDGLATIDGTLKAVPVLADSFESTADCMTWTVKLKEDIQWHDGKYFSSEDVKFTIEKIMGDPEGKYYNCVENIASVEASDAYTIIIKCKDPDSFFAEKMYFPIIPKDKDVSSTPVGTGLYKFKSVNDQQLELEAFTKNAAPLGKNEPYISGVIVKFYASVTDVIYSDCDVVLVRYEDYDRVNGKIGYSVKKYVGTEYEVLAVNNTKDILKESAFRRAVAYAINVKDAVGSINSVKSVITDIPLLPEAWIRTMGSESISYDQQKAKDFLEMSGYSGQELTLLVNKDNEDRIKFAEYFKKNLEDIGMKIKIVEESAENIESKISEKDYELALIGIKVPLIDDVADFYISGSSKNFSGYANGELDELFKKLSDYIYDDERKSVYQDIEKVLLSDIPFVGLYFKQNFIFYNSGRVYGISSSNPNYMDILWGIEEWFLVEENK